MRERNRRKKKDEKTLNETSFSPPRMVSRPASSPPYFSYLDINAQQTPPPLGICPSGIGGYCIGLLGSRI